jgi:hypothetical protein
MTGLDLKQLQLPSQWHYLLPESKLYFGSRVALSKPNATGWAQGKCPFHNDPHAAFHVNLKWDVAQWRCVDGCGHGTMVDFHARLYDLEVDAAISQLLRGDV